MVIFFKIIKLHSLTCEKPSLKIRGNFKYETENVHLMFNSKKDMFEYKDHQQKESGLQLDFYYYEKNKQ